MKNKVGLPTIPEVYFWRKKCDHSEYILQVISYNIFLVDFEQVCIHLVMSVHLVFYKQLVCKQLALGWKNAKQPSFTKQQ